MSVRTDTSGSKARDRLRRLSIILALIGLATSVYLTWAKLTSSETVCVQGLSNCTAVQSSVYSYLGPIPVAYLGLAGYLAILLALIFEQRIPILAQRGRLIIFTVTLLGFLFSAYLTAIEAFVLYEWCQWCVISAITMTILCGISFVRLWREISTVPADETEA